MLPRSHEEQGARGISALVRDDSRTRQGSDWPGNPENVGPMWKTFPAAHGRDMMLVLLQQPNASDPHTRRSGMAIVISRLDSVAHCRDDLFDSC